MQAGLDGTRWQVNPEPKTLNLKPWTLNPEP